MPLAAGFSDIFSSSLAKVWHFLLIGGWFMVPLVICSILLVAAVVWKYRELNMARLIPEGLAARLREAGPLTAAGQFGVLQQAIAADASVLAAISRVALLHPYPDQAAAARAAEAAGREEVAAMERGIALMEVIFTIAPMLGLIGTVGGLVRVFGNFGEAAKDAAAAQEIAAGIAEVMTTTITGLAIAVPALIAQVYFSRKVEHCALRMGSLVNGALDAVWQANRTVR